MHDKNINKYVIHMFAQVCIKPNNFKLSFCSMNVPSILHHYHHHHHNNKHNYYFCLIFRAQPMFCEFNEIIFTWNPTINEVSRTTCIQIYKNQLNILRNLSEQIGAYIKVWIDLKFLEKQLSIALLSLYNKHAWGTKLNENWI